MSLRTELSLQVVCFRVQSGLVQSTLGNIFYVFVSTQNVIYSPLSTLFQSFKELIWLNHLLHRYFLWVRIKYTNVHSGRILLATSKLSIALGLDLGINSGFAKSRSWFWLRSLFLPSFLLCMNTCVCASMCVHTRVYHVTCVQVKGQLTGDALFYHAASRDQTQVPMFGLPEPSLRTLEKLLLHSIFYTYFLKFFWKIMFILCYACF